MSESQYYVTLFMIAIPVATAVGMTFGYKIGKAVGRNERDYENDRRERLYRSTIDELTYRLYERGDR